MPKRKEKYNFELMFNSYTNTLYCLYDYALLKAKITEKKENTGQMKIGQYLFDQNISDNLGSSISHISHIAVENGYKMAIELLKGSLDKTDKIHELGDLKKVLIKEIEAERDGVINYFDIIYDYFRITKEGSITDNYHGTLACGLRSLELGLGINGYMKKHKIIRSKLLSKIGSTLDWLKNSSVFMASRYGTQGIKIPKLITVKDILYEKKKIEKNIGSLGFIGLILKNYFDYKQNPQSYKRKPNKNKKFKGAMEFYLHQYGEGLISYRKTQKDPSSLS